jgi:DNA-directed RNA polymerase specialized sigma24 family protein
MSRHDWRGIESIYSHKNWIFRRLAFVFDDSIAEDAIQTATINLAFHSGDRSPRLLWRRAYQAAQNAIRRRDRDCVPLSFEIQFDDNIDGRVAASAFVASMPDDCADVMLRMLDGASYSEVASEMGRSSKWVQKRVEKIRAMLEDAGGDPSVKFGSRHRRVSADDVRRLRGDGLSWSAIGVRLGIAKESAMRLSRS